MSARIRRAFPTTDREMPGRLAAMTAINPGEGRKVLLCLGLSFCLGVVEVLLYASSRAIFLSHYGSGDLPLVYVGVALAVTACGLSFGLLQRRVPHGLLLVGMLAALAASLVGFRFWLDAGGGVWAAMLLAVWFEVVFILGSLAFWGLAGILFNVRQAKRLYGLIGSGEYLATLLAGLASPWLARQIGAVDLLWPTAGMLVLAMFLGAALAREADRTAPRRETRKEKDTGRTAPPAPGVRTYLAGMHLVWGLAICGLFLTDLVLNTQAEAYASDMTAMASFFGRFYAVAGALVLLARLTVSGRVLMAVGPMNTLILLPGVLALMTLALVSGTTLLAEAGTLMLWLAVGCRLLDYVLRYSFHKPAFMVLYQPLARHRRLAAQATVEGIAEPAAILAVGLLLLAGRRVFPLDLIHVSWLLLAVLAAWHAALYLIRGRYRDVLMAALRRGRVHDSDMALAHPQARRALVERLTGPDPAEVVPAMDLLRRHAPAELSRALPGLLARTEPEVLLEVLNLLARPATGADALPVPGEAAAMVRAMAEGHDDPPVRGAALAALPGLPDPQSRMQMLLLAGLDHADPAVRLGAAAGLGRCGPGPDTQSCHEAVNRLLDNWSASPDPDRRAEAARMAGAFACAGTTPVLTRLLGDDDPEVALAALTACANPGLREVVGPDLAEALLGMAARRGMRARAVRALAVAGPDILPILERAMDDPAGDRRMRLAAVRATARMGEADLAPGQTDDLARGQALAVLVMRLGTEDNELRGAVLEGLEQLGWTPTRQVRDVLVQAMRDEAALAAWCLECREAVSPEDGEALAKALEEEADGAAKRLLALLALARPSAALDRARRRLTHPDPAQRALALEMLESLLGQGDKRLMLPLLLTEEADQRLELLRAALGRTPEPPGGWLAAAIDGRTGRGGLLAWTRAAALHLAGSSRRGPETGPAIQEAVRLAVHDPIPLVAETARFAAQSLTP